MLKLTAAMPFLLAASSFGQPAPEPEAGLEQPPGELEFIGAQLKPLVLPKLDFMTLESRPEVTPPHAKFKDAATGVYYFLDCKAMRSIVTSGVIGLATSDTAKEKEEIGNVLQTVRMGQIALGCNTGLRL